MIATAKKPQETDICLPQPLPDGISSLALNGDVSSLSNILIATCWDNTVSCYELQYNGSNVVGIQPKAQARHDAPALCSDFAPDKVTVFTGGADNAVRMWNVTSGSTNQTIGQHDAPVKCVKFNSAKNMVLSGSWDKTIKLWDARTPTPVGTLQFADRVYAMDTKDQALVVCTADKQLHVFDMNAGNKMFEFKSTLTYQTRCVAIFNDNKGFAEGCIEGRVALEYFDELQGKSSNAPKPANAKSFAFKCHRQEVKDTYGASKSSDIFPVNSVHFHHPYNTFLTAGSDGCVCVWDKDARHRVSYFDRFVKQNSVSDAKFAPSGNLLVYALSYDWSRGVEGNDSKLTNQIYVHNLQPAEVQPKTNTGAKK
eukprot:gene24244-29316_t